MMRSLLLSISLLFTIICSSGAVTGTWINHSAIDIDSQITRTTAPNVGFNYICKMFESENYVYILAHGKGYNTLSYGMKKISLLPSYIDKNTGNFESLANKYKLSGARVVDMTYAPSTGILAICYDNKLIDFINENTGEVTSAVGFSTYITPGGAHPGRIQFDRNGETLTVASNFGFMAFDAFTGEIVSLCKLDETVQMAVKMGNRFIGYKASGFFEVPASLSTTSSQCTPLNITGYENLVDGIMPVNDDSLIILTTTTTYSNIRAYGVTFNENEESQQANFLFTEGLNNSSMGLANTMITIHPLEGLFWPIKGGMAMSGNTNFWIVNFNDPEVSFSTTTDCTSFVASNTRKIPKDTSNPKAGHFGLERYQKATTMNGETFWFLRPRHGLIKRLVTIDAKNKATWTDASDIIEPNMSATLTPYYMTWHPEYGVLARIQGGRYGENDEFPSVKYLSDGLCAFKDGKWTRHSVFHKKFDVTSQLPMMWSPRGIAYDPLEPQYIYEVSASHGLHKMDITDPSYHLLMSSDEEVNKNQPGYVCITPSMQWPKAAFSLPTFDANGTMWLNLYTRQAIRGDEYHPTELWYWTAEDRLAVKTPEDYAAHPMKQIKFDDVESLFRGINVPLTMEGCTNYLLHCPGFYNTTYLYDHAGTLEDTSDDRICLFDNTVYENGDAFPSIFVGQRAIQDPYDGKVLLATDRGYVVFDPHQVFEEKQIMDWLQPDESDEPAYSPHPLGTSNSWGIIVDNLGRKWISTTGEGLYCISPDRKKVLAQFTEKNSPLSDNLYGLVYNPERNSIMVGTEYGVMEFIPSGSELEELGASTPIPSVFPRSLHPDYQGHILFSGLKDGKYNIVTTNGDIVDTIEVISGKADWHPANLRHTLIPDTYSLEGVAGTDFIVL